jgi:parallel beta-helix repeat protein
MNFAKKFSVLLILAVILLLPVVATRVVTAQPIFVSIKADGNVEGTSAIQRNGNVYTLTSNLEEASIVIDASNIVLDGAGFTLQGEIYQINGDNVEIKNLKIIAPDIAIALYGSGCSVLDNDIETRHTGVKIRKSDNNVISSNIIAAEIGVGIAFETSSNNIVTGNRIESKMIEGVSLDYSDDNVFSENTISFADVYQSSYNTFDGNNFPQGLMIRRSSNYNNITGNTVKDFNELTETCIASSGSIYVERGEGNIISSNTISNSGGIFLDTASNNMLRNNSVSGTGIGFEVSGGPQPSLSSFINDIDVSNTVNGKKVYYLINKRDVGINPSDYPDIGYLALVNCTGMTVENNNLNTQGILMVWTTNSQITNNDISGNYGDGVILNYASNNQITQNNINSNSGVGIRLSSSNQNTVSVNYITENQEGVYFLHSANNNTITENNIADQDIGIHFYMSSNNSIYHNNFVNNTQHVYDPAWDAPDLHLPGVPLPSENIWDNYYPVGGNYWSNYTLQYPDAQELDNSGIWNKPYIIDEYNQDRYPLLNPVEISLVQVPDDSNGDNPTTQAEESFPTTLVIASAVLVIIVGTGLLLYFKKRKNSSYT